MTEIQMHARDELERIARGWMSRWCAPVERALLDRPHARRFEDWPSVGRPTGRAGIDIIEAADTEIARRRGEADVSAHVARG